MSYPAYCRPYYNTSYACDLPWWQDTRYDPHCYYPSPTPLKRSYSFDSSSLKTYKPRKTHSQHPVKIFVNIRYKYTSNSDTLLCDQVCVEISPNCCVMDVWHAAKKYSPHLRQFQPTEKVLTTDSHQKYFTEICSQATIKDEYYKGERHWVFVVYPPYYCKPIDDKNMKEKKERKRKAAKKDKKKSSRKKTSNFSCSCGCC